MSHTVQWTEFLDTAARTEHERLALLEHIFDPFSIENLDRIGIRPGWRCLEAGTTLPEQSTRPVAGKMDRTAIGQAIPALGRGPMSRWLADTYRLVDEATLAGGTVSGAELDEAYAAYADPSFVDYTWLTVAAAGRKPAA